MAERRGTTPRLYLPERNPRRWILRGLRYVLLGAGVSVLLLGTAYLVVKAAPDSWAQHAGLDSRSRVAERQGVRTSCLALLGGTFAFVSAIYTARTFGLNRSGQLTDRFSRAIEQLGHGELDVRLGGIYALERIARDSRLDHPQVIEVLTAFVREHAGGVAEIDEAVDIAQVDSGFSAAQRRPPTDVQAVLTVLGRRTVAHDRAEPTISPLNLAGTCLRGSRLRFANLGEADLRGADLRESDFFGANLSRADLTDADLAGADIGVAHLVGATLERANLRGAKLVATDLRRAALQEASLQEIVALAADFSLSKLNKANLNGANLGGSYFDVTDLTEALVTSADFRQAHLDEAFLDGARFNSDTVWPDGFDPTAAGARPVDG